MAGYRPINRLRSGRFSHRIQRRPGEKPRACLTLLTRVGVNCAKNSLRQSDVDSGGLVSELTDVNVYDRPGPAAIAALAAQLHEVACSKLAVDCPIEKSKFPAPARHQQAHTDRPDLSAFVQTCSRVACDRLFNVALHGSSGDRGGRLLRGRPRMRVGT